MATRYPAIAPSWRRAWAEVIPFLDDPPEVRRLIYITDVIDKREVGFRGIFRSRGRPRGEKRRIGCERPWAAYPMETLPA